MRWDLTLLSNIVRGLLFSRTQCKSVTFKFCELFYISEAVKIKNFKFGVHSGYTKCSIGYIYIHTCKNLDQITLTRRPNLHSISNFVNTWIPLEYPQDD